MNLPFTIDQFFAVFARYNESVWPMQIFLYGLAGAVIIALLRPRPYSGRLIAAVLAFFWAWMGLAYHFAFFAAINPAARLFGLVFLAGAALFAWTGIYRIRLRLALRNDLRGWIGGFLLLFALVLYPLIGLLIGHRYPAAPTFGLPCPTTIFTIGVLLFAEAPARRSVFIVPLLWSAGGSLAAIALHVPQDYGLLLAGLIGLIALVMPAPAACKAP